MLVGTIAIFSTSSYGMIAILATNKNSLKQK
jgi:hypothetical protein